MSERAIDPPQLYQKSSFWKFDSKIIMLFQPYVGRESKKSSAIISKYDENTLIITSKIKTWLKTSYIHNKINK